MQSEESRAQDIKNAIDQIKNTSRFRQKLKGNKSIVFLFAENETAGSQINEIARYAMKNILKVEKSQGKKEESNQTREDFISLYQEQFLLLENHDLRLIAVNASEQDISIVTLACLLILNQAHEHNFKVKVIAAINQSKKEFQTQIRSARDYIGVNLGQLMILEAKIEQGQQEQSKNYVKNVKVHSTKENAMPEQPKQKLKNELMVEAVQSRKIVLKGNEKSFSLEQFIQKNVKNIKGQEELKEVRKYFQKHRRELQNFEIALLAPVKQILKKVIERSEQDIINVRFPDLKNQFGELVVPKPKIAIKNDKQIAFKWFVYRCLKIKEDFEGQLKGKFDPIKWLNEFFTQIFKQLRSLPIIQAQELDFIESVNKIFIEQFKILMGISADLFIPQNTAIVAQLTLKDNQGKDIDQFTMMLKLTESIMASELKEGKKPNYYYLFEDLIAKCFESVKLENTKNRVSLEEKKNAFLKQIPLMRIMAIIRNSGSSKEEIVQEVHYIKEFLLKFVSPESSDGKKDLSGSKKQLSDKKNTGSGKDWNILIQILSKSAEKLKSYGFPQVAMELFKKVRFEAKVQSCVKDIILQKGWQGQKEASELYINVADYFHGVGNWANSVRYAQLAYENWPSEWQYLKKLLQKKERRAKSEVTKENFALLSEINTKNLDAYFNYEFPSSFEQDLKNMVYVPLDNETTFEVDESESLAKMLDLSICF